VPTTRRVVGSNPTLPPVKRPKRESWTEVLAVKNPTEVFVLIHIRRATRLCGPLSFPPPRNSSFRLLLLSTASPPFADIMVRSWVFGSPPYLRPRCFARTSSAHCTRVIFDAPLPCESCVPPATEARLTYKNTSNLLTMLPH
jgi:hypothetical protein